MTDKEKKLQAKKIDYYRKQIEDLKEKNNFLKERNALFIKERADLCHDYGVEIYNNTANKIELGRLTSKLISSEEIIKALMKELAESFELHGTPIEMSLIYCTAEQFLMEE